MPLVVLALLVTAAVGAIIRAATDDGGTAARAAPRTAAARTPRGALLLVHRGAQGRADFITVVGAHGRAASVLLVPTSTQVEVPSLGVQALADLPNAGSGPLMQTTVENMLGVRVADTLVVDDAGLEAMLGPAPPVRVELADEVDLGPDHAPLGVGAHDLPAPVAARALTTPQPGSELDRLVTTQAVLDGWLARLRVRSVARATLAQQPGLGLLVAAARAPDRRTDTLPVQSVATGGGERFELRRGDLVRYVREAFPQALLAPGGHRPRVEILNGTGAVGVAQATAGVVVPAGGEVTLSGNVPGFGLQQTQVVYYDPSQRRAAQGLLDAIGCGVLKRSATGFNVVDVTILVGADCPAFGAPTGE
jgi:hypothetical protein